MKTLRQQYAEALSKLGENQVDAKGHTIKFTRSGYLPKQFYFLGKSGSLRVGINKSTSIPVSQKLKDQLLNEVK